MRVSSNEWMFCIARVRVGLWRARRPRADATEMLRVMLQGKTLGKHKRRDKSEKSYKIEYMFCATEH